MRGFILLSLALTAVLSTSAVSQTTGAYRWGINGHPITNGYDSKHTSYTHVPVATQIDLIAELGAGWYRVGLRPEDLLHNRARFDEVLAAAEKKNIRLLPVLLPSQRFWQEIMGPDEIQAEAHAFAKEMGDLYKGRVTHWELANELDNYALLRKGETSRTGRKWVWDEAPEGSSNDDYDNRRYGRVKAQVVGLYEGLKAADPTAVTVLDTAGWLHYGFIERFINEEKVTPFDILSWHWYSQMGSITNVQGKRNMVEFLKRYGKPLWMTETNFFSQSSDPQGMADYIRKSVAEMGAIPEIECIFIYELLAQPYLTGAEPNYGLVDIFRDAGRFKIKGKKPGFDAFRDVIRDSGATAKKQ